MSIAGITQFKKNLDLLTSSKGFKEMGEAERLTVGLAMVRGNPHKQKAAFLKLKKEENI